MDAATDVDVRFASAVSTAEDTNQAARDVLSGLGSWDTPPDLALVFVSPHHVKGADALARVLGERLGAANLLGCTGETIIGNGQEFEESPAVSLWAAWLPKTTIKAFALEYERTPEGGAFRGWPDELTGTWPEDALLLLLGDPFSFPADVFLSRINEDRPRVRVAGGMASAGHAPGQNRLLLGGETFAEGAVAVYLQGGVSMRTIVSQGCRPIGKPFVVTKAERNVIAELGGKPAFAQLREIFQSLPTRDKQLVQTSLHVGRVVSEYRDHFEQGDFLIRNVIGLDPKQGAIAIGDYIRPGQTVQFHVRDADAADGELKQLAAAVAASGGAPAGGLLFACNGRGTRMFPEPHHDARVLAEKFGPIPVSGFFAMGELGAVGEQNFVHGHTASIVLFE
jgi:small ligand-binding sensory domain FIST